MIEVMITVAIVAILASLATPAFQTMLLNNRQSALKNAFINATNFARSTALTRNAKINICPFSALGSVNCGAAWSAGWIVLTAPTSGTPTLLQSYQTGPRDPVLTAIAFNEVVATSLIFDSRGLSTTQSNFIICDSRGSSYATSIQVLLTGFAQAGPTPGQAIWGGAITCP